MSPVDLDRDQRGWVLPSPVSTQTRVLSWRRGGDLQGRCRVGYHSTHGVGSSDDRLLGCGRGPRGFRGGLKETSGVARRVWDRG